MKKNVFVLFAVFVCAYIMVAWHFASIELASVNEEELPGSQAATELVQSF